MNTLLPSSTLSFCYFVSSIIYVLVVLLFYIIVIDILILYRDNDCSNHTMIYIILSITVPFIYGVLLLSRKCKMDNDIYVLINYILCIWGILEYFTIKRCQDIYIYYNIVLVLFTYQAIIYIIYMIRLIKEINNYIEDIIIVENEQSMV